MDANCGYPSSQAKSPYEVCSKSIVDSSSLGNISGNWVADSHCNLGVTTNIMDQLRVVRDRPLLAQRMNVTHVIVKLDAMVVIDLMKHSTNENVLLGTLIQDCRTLLMRFPSRCVQHTFGRVTAMLTH